MDDWWFTRLLNNTEEAEEYAQTKFENDSDAHRKGES